MKIGRGVSELWRVENRPLPLTWPMAYTTACTTVQAVINQTLNLILTLIIIPLKQHIVVRIQLNIVTCPKYPEKFIRDNSVSVFLLFSVVFVYLSPIASDTDRIAYLAASLCCCEAVIIWHTDNVVCDSGLQDRLMLMQGWRRGCGC